MALDAHDDHQDLQVREMGAALRPIDECRRESVQPREVRAVLQARCSEHAQAGRGGRPGIAIALGVMMSIGLGACRGDPPSATALLSGHGWRTVSRGGGPTYTFGTGGRIEMSNQGVTLSGTYETPTDSTLVATVEGRIPGVGAGGPVRLPLRFVVRVMSPGHGGRPRVEFRSGTVADTLVRLE